MCGIEGGEWYRKWSDKWLEQCSESTFSGSWKAGAWYTFKLNLLSAYRDTKFFAQSHYEGTDTATNLGHVEDRTTSSINAVTIPRNTLTSVNFKWVAMGYVS